MMRKKDLKVGKVKKIEGETLYQGFLSALEIKIEKVRPTNVAKVMAALEAEFKVQGNGFPKHFGNDVADQSKLFGFSWQDITGIERKTFRKAFAQVGITYTEQEYRDICDGEAEFGDLFYCRVKTSYKNRTLYYRSKLVEGLIEDYKQALKNDLEGANQELGLKK